jgi:hypothetical protein
MSPPLAARASPRQTQTTDTNFPMKTSTRKAPTEEQKAASAAKRAALCAMTSPFRPYVEKNNEAACALLAGASREELTAWLTESGVPAKFQFCMTLNACLQVVYRETTGQSEFHTFQGWKELGFSVEKGSKGFTIWSTPKKMQVEGNTLDDNGDPEKKTVQRFALAYLFHAGQVSNEAGERPASYSEQSAEITEPAPVLALPESREEIPAALVKEYENKLVKVKAFHPGWRGEEYVEYAEAELAAVKSGGLPALKAFWAAKPAPIAEAPAPVTEAAPILTIWDVETPALGQQLLICAPPRKAKPAAAQVPATIQDEFDLLAA